jgi:hypothetical protein
MRIALCILATFSIAFTGCPSSGSSDNLLIGTWINGDNNGCADRVVFTASTYTSHYAANGPHATYEDVAPARYSSISAQSVTVTGKSAASTSDEWDFTDSNHVTTGYAGFCRYTRQ